jgi:prepilin-type N-terminal cleavage/methylation domain-containing protein
MKKKGFTFLELMIAISIFLMMVVLIVKLDSNTHEQIRSITDITDKANIAFSELERIKSNPMTAINTTKVIDDYRVTITRTTNNTMYPDIVEITILVESGSAAVDINPYKLKTHLLAK